MKTENWKMILLLFMIVPFGLSDEDDWTGIRMETKYNIPQSLLIHVQNDHGDVIIDKSPDEKVYVTANVHQKKAFEKTCEVKPDIKSDRINLHVEFQLDDPAEKPNSSRRKVELILLLPAGSPLAIETSSGNIEVKGIEGAVNVKTVSGSVDLRTFGQVICSNQSGKTKIHFMNKEKLDGSKIESEKGKIHLYIPRGSDVKILGETMARTVSDFSMEARLQGATHLRNTEVLLGNGTQTVTATSKQGTLHFLSFSAGSNQKAAETK